MDGRPRFGLNVSTASDADPVADAQNAEALGFDLVTCSDHLRGEQPNLETWTLLTWIASRTTRIQLAPNVLGLPYRHPAVTAKMAETLDRMSGGRLVLGLGAGGNDDEFRGFGIDPGSPGEKVQGLAEAVGIMRRLWSDGHASLHGERYIVPDARIAPAAQRDIPIWFGAYGPRMLRLTGRIADGWMPSMPYAGLDRVGPMRDVVLGAAREAGRGEDAIECGYNIWFLVDGDPTRSERVVAGTPEQMAEKLAAIVKLGMTTLNFWPVREEAEQVERLAVQVLPLVRERTGG